MSSPGNADAIIEGANPNANTAIFNCTIDGINENILFARTGDRGFMWPVPSDAVKSRAVVLGEDKNLLTGWEGLVYQDLPYEMMLFKIGSLKEEININGYIYYPEDIEATIEQCHPSAGLDGCAVFKAGHETVALIECTHPEAILNLSFRIITVILDKFQFIVDAIVFMEKGKLYKSRHNEKQRKRLRDAYIAGKL